MSASANSSRPAPGAESQPGLAKRATGWSAPADGHAKVALPDWAEHLVRALDDGLRIPGTDIRFGFDAILGFFLPGVGDVLTGGGSVAIILLALRRGVPRVVLFRMLLNVLLDAGVGMVPVLGDLFDVTFKSNRRNLQLLQRADHGSSDAARPLDYAVVGLAILGLFALLALPGLLAVWLFTRGAG